MLEAPLIVPTLLSSGSLHFAEVKSDGTLQDIIDALTNLQDVRLEILGELEEHAWALQRIRVERTGRKWEDEELELQGDGKSGASFQGQGRSSSTGILTPDTAISPIVNNSGAESSLQRHFSSFPYTSHLHSPAIRLVSLHPLLSLTLSFLRVPEIHDGYERKFFISRMTTVQMLVNSVIEELGLTKALPIPGGGTLEYVLEEVWLDGSARSACLLCMLLRR
jgi:diaphanous 1